MAVSSVSPDVTSEIAFGHSDTCPEDLLRVIPGVNANLVEDEAFVLETNVARMLRDAANNGGMEAHVAAVCAFALQAAGALRTAVARVD